MGCSMKFINYESIKNWKSKLLADIIDVTDDIPEKIKTISFSEETDWLQFVHLGRYYDETSQSDEFQQQIMDLYNRIMNALNLRFHKKRRNLKRTMRDSAIYSHQQNYLYQSMFNYCRYHLRHYYQPSYDYYSNYEIYALQNAFSDVDWGFIQGEVESYIQNLPPVSEELRELFSLTEYGTEKLWWDLDGHFRHQTELTQVQLNIMNSTTPRHSKPWEGKYHHEILALYLEYWEIILDESLKNGPTRSEKRNDFIRRIESTAVNPWEESRYDKIISALLKVAENTIRKKRKIREIKIVREEETLTKRFRKEVVEKIQQRNQEEIQQKVLKKPKVIRLNKEKISSSQADLSTVVDLISDFVGDEELSVSESASELETVVLDEIVEPVEPLDDDPNIVYKQFVQRILEQESISQEEANEFCRERGFLLNAFINNINQFLYDFIDDQVVVNEGDQIIIDEFYVDEMKELLANDFKEV